MKINVLKRNDFPSNVFFKHLQKGTEYYQNHDFGRAIEEWRAAARLRFSEPVYLRPIEGRVFFGSMIQELPFLFFLYAIYTNKVTGVGLMKHEGEAKKFAFTKGVVVFAATTQKESRIGNFVLKKKNLAPEQMEQLVGEAKRKGEKLGKHLVKRGLISSKVLQEILTLQVQEILGDSLFTKKGHFYFAEKPLAEEIIVKYSPLQCGLISAQRGFNFARFRKEIPSNTVVFRPSPYVEEDKEKIIEKLNANEEFVLSIIDGVRNIDQIGKFSGTDEVSLMNILFRLSAMGLIRKTKEVGEYEDKEFKEISRLLKVFFEIYHIITADLFREMGKRGKEVIVKAHRNLKADYQVVFVDVPLDKPDELDINPFFRNMASYFPSPKQRTVFMDAFHGLYVNILDELVRFLGMGLTKEAVTKINIMKADLQTFSLASPMKNRSLEILEMIVQKYS